MTGAIESSTPPLHEALLHARLHDPFSFLGLHQHDSHYTIRGMWPHASKVWLHTAGGDEAFVRTDPRGLYEWHGEHEPPSPYRLLVETDGVVRDVYDPYAFPPHITEHDLYLFNEGNLHQAYDMLGTHHITLNGVNGVRFACWAPNAERVSVIGDFNHWDGRVHPMRSRGSSGVWELFIPSMHTGGLYKYEIRNRDSGHILVKSDPYAQEFERRPGTAAKVHAEIDYAWHDDEWIDGRSNWDWLHAPLNVYEMHVGSWRRHPDGRFYTYRELAEHLIPYVQEMGYTHIELLPISEHPLDE